MSSAGTVVQVVDRETGEILDDWHACATQGRDLPDLVLNAAAYCREVYSPKRLYFDVEREGAL